MKKRAIVLKFYSNNHYLPSYDKYYYFDLDNDESFNKAFSEAAYKMWEVGSANGEEIKGRIEDWEI